MSKRLTLVLGGVRAGKSSYAQRLASEGGGRVLFVATAEAGDADMATRIQAHRRDRPPDWDTLEEPVDLVGALSGVSNRYNTVLLDCLTLWVSNLLLRSTDIDSSRTGILTETEWLLDVFRRGSASWVVVSNEVGLGVVPPTRLGRVFADELGRVNQFVAAAADDVYFMAAGLAMPLKESSD